MQQYSPDPPGGNNDLESRAAKEIKSSLGLNTQPLLSISLQIPFNFPSFSCIKLAKSPMFRRQRQEDKE
jgi:hypothetical protein